MAEVIASAEGAWEGFWNFIDKCGVDLRFSCGVLVTLIIVFIMHKMFKPATVKDVERINKRLTRENDRLRAINKEKEERLDRCHEKQRTLEQEIDRLRKKEGGKE